jgi:hypothetical protein
MEFNKYFKEKISLTKNYKYFQFWQPTEVRLQITGDILRTDYRKHHSHICWWYQKFISFMKEGRYSTGGTTNKAISTGWFFD